jgi:ABC-type nickel/cobalt efflux system permease component RcnA
MAILADTGATVLVTLNALRLLRLLPAVRPAAATGHAPGHDHDHDHGHAHDHDHAAHQAEAEDCCAHGACGSPPANVACGACRAPNQASAHFCSQCGQAMAA